MWDRLVSWAHHAWVEAVRVGRVLWACRVSATSAVLGLVLFWVAVPAQNLFADTAWNASLVGAIGYWSAVFTALFVVWAFPVHYGARWTLDDDAWLVSPSLRRNILAQKDGAFELAVLEQRVREDHAFAIEWVPRVLGVLPFLAFAIGILHALVTYWVSNGLRQGKETLDQLVLLLVVDIAMAVAFVAFVIYRKPLIDLVARKMPGWPVDKDPLEKFVWISLFATFAIFVLAYHFPFIPATILPRALLIPFLFGSLVLILSWLQRCVHRDGVPYITIVVIGCLLVTGLNRHFNDLRTVPPRPTDLPQRQIALAAAVERWKAANDCSDKPCPPALVVAIDGGASRAAFTAATFVGEILDRMPPAPGRGPDAARRIFALSGVSGGSVGAATIRTALADALSDPKGAPPCRNADRTWFRAEELAGSKRAFTWRECLQALVTGDYLSPVFIGLGFRDNFAPAQFVVAGPSWIDDRAALLERAIEQHYSAVVGRPGTKETGLERRFGYLPLAYKTSEDDKAWLPLLLLNVTSVQTGRRIVVSDLASTYLDESMHPVGLYSQAYDIFEMMSSPCKAPDLKGQDCDPATAFGLGRFDLDAPDLRLSTAAVASARFPVISPAGALAVEGSPRFGDRLVDGGYFENSGDTTALDIAEALLAHGVQPVILSIANDPELEVVDVAVPQRQVVTPFVGVSTNDFWARVFGIFKAPVQALLATRDGHGAEAKDLVVRTFASCKQQSCPMSTFFKLGVAARPNLDADPDASPYDKEQCKSVWTDAEVDVAKIALSWWLSGSLQAELDAQRCTKENRKTMQDLMTLLAPT